MSAVLMSSKTAETRLAEQIADMNGRRRERVLDTGAASQLAMLIADNPEARRIRINSGFVANAYAWPAIQTYVEAIRHGTRWLAEASTSRAQRPYGHGELVVIRS